MEQFAIPDDFKVFPSPGTPISRLATFLHYPLSNTHEPLFPPMYAKIRMNQK
jgi:hypothetical protein